MGAAKGDLDTAFDGHTVHRDDRAGRMDYRGMNYYFRQVIKGTPTSLVPSFSPLLTITPASLAITEEFPRGIYDMLMRVTRDYGVPIYVTENGTPWDQGDASAYLDAT
jgi:beta-glucosidase